MSEIIETMGREQFVLYILMCFVSLRGIRKTGPRYSYKFTKKE